MVSVTTNFETLLTYKPSNFFIDSYINNASWKKYLNVRTYKRGETIYQANQRAESLYFIKSGRVKVTVLASDCKRIIKAIYQNNELFGELGVVGQLQHTETVTAMEETTLYVLPLNIAKNMVQKDQQFANLITSLIGQRLMLTQRRLESLVFKDARSRIIQFLLDLVEKRGRRVGYEMLVNKFFTHQEIANLTDTSRQTVTTVLNELRSVNLIYFDRKRLLVRDMNKLAVA